MRRIARGFTLIEVLIVMVILGILAAIAIAGFGSSSLTVRENTLRESLLQMRTQITAYCLHHRDIPPAGTTFREQLCGITDEEGQLGSGPDFRFGPYLSDIPANAVNGKRTIKLLRATETATADDSTGWIYQPLASGFNFMANTTGADSTGRTYFSY